ncbi:MAG TPA: glycosyltransferase family 2 protein [Cyclobacteriaceae bacterium]|nr:glycosyltransferase family 2 protein [Cyclobacteriaceae bacterium]
MEDVGIILINYNTSDYTINCIKSFDKHKDSERKTEFIVIDNNSNPEEFLKLSELKSRDDLQLIRNEINLGYSAANMMGINHCRAKYYFFINNDTEILNDNISILFDFMESHIKAGICSGQMYDAPDKPGINFNYFPDLKLKLLGHGILNIFYPEEYPSKKIIYRIPVRVPVLNGSSLFVRASVFNELGGFDSQYFLYCEEEDLAIRMKNSGYSCYLVPGAKYLHYKGKSSISDEGINLVMLKEFYLSQHFFYRKHYGTTASWIWRITQFIRTIRKFYIHPDYFRLAFFILSGPQLHQSLRYRQSQGQ